MTPRYSIGCISHHVNSRIMKLPATHVFAWYKFPNSGPALCIFLEFKQISIDFWECLEAITTQIKLLFLPPHAMSMIDGFVRTSTAGRILRWITRARVLQYPDELSDSQCSACYTDAVAPDFLFRNGESDAYFQVSRKYSLERAPTTPVAEYSVAGVSEACRSPSAPTARPKYQLLQIWRRS